MLVFVAGMSSCESIKSIFDVEIDTVLSGDLDIEIQESPMKSTNGYDFESFTEVNPLEDDDVKEYEEKIKEFLVNGITVEAVYVDKGDVVFEEGTTFYITDANSKVTWTLKDNWTVLEGTTIDLEDLGDVYKAVAEILNKKKKFTVGAMGTCSQTNVYITLRVGIDTKVIANPL
jgi:hypothetical protein